MTINVGDTVLADSGPYAGEIHMVESVRDGRVWVTPWGIKNRPPYPVRHLTKIDAGTFKVGDRVTRASGVYAGNAASVVKVSGDRITITGVSDRKPNGSYVASDLKLMPMAEFDLSFVDVGSKTVTRVVAVFQSNEVPEIDLSVATSSAAAVWIDYLKNAPGLTTLTVTRSTTEVFTYIND